MRIYPSYPYLVLSFNSACPKWMAALQHVIVQPDISKVLLIDSTAQYESLLDSIDSGHIHISSFDS